LAELDVVPEGLRERNKREKLERIRRAARELFLERGFDGTTAREVCRRAAIGTGTLFLYVRDKRELLFLVFAEEARRRFAVGRAAAAQRASLVDALMALFAAFFEFYAAHPELAGAIARELFFREHEPRSMGALTREYGLHVAAVVEEARGRGELDPEVSTADAATACFAHYAFWTLGWLGSGLLDRAQAEAGLRRALELQVRGLGGTAAPRPERG